MNKYRVYRESGLYDEVEADYWKQVGRFVVFIRKLKDGDLSYHQNTEAFHMEHVARIELVETDDN